MKVKSFCVGLIGGYGAAFEVLDEWVEMLGASKICKVKDTFYAAIGGEPGEVEPKKDATIVRVVTYETQESC